MKGGASRNPKMVQYGPTMLLSQVQALICFLHDKC